ncbi:MAG TPA: homoserine O-acetyltransferase [Opitutales bacterium]|nr:homoserine O-acetyltransferase [Opitutales bacterium]
MNDASPEELIESQAGEIGLVSWQDYVCGEPFVFENGRQIPSITIRYETYGRLNAARDNAILICHALSGDHHCAGIHSIRDNKPGWWNNIIGPGKPVDTDKWFVVCSNCLGGCVGSTGPTSTNPGTGKPYGLDFPQLTIRDMVRAQKKLLDHLSVARLFAIVGGSMGGMQALQWMIDYPDYVAKVVALATTGRQSAQAIAFNEVGRSAITQDPGWNGGSYEKGQGPRVGLAVARMMAHITYLSDTGLEEKFGRARASESDGKPFGAEFEIEEYLRYQGQSFINRFDANTYLYFTKALDRFDLYGPSGRLEDSFANVRAKVLNVGFTSDWLYPPSQNRALVHALLRCGRDATYAELDMKLGHDSFLVHAPELYRLVSGFLGN